MYVFLASFCWKEFKNVFFGFYVTYVCEFRMGEYEFFIMCIISVKS